MSIYDLNVFLEYLCELKGAGAMKEKAERILLFGQKVSVI